MNFLVPLCLLMLPQRIQIVENQPETTQVRFGNKHPATKFLKRKHEPVGRRGWEVVVKTPLVSFPDPGDIGDDMGIPRLSLSRR